MRYNKIISNGYIISIGKGGNSGIEITQEEYENILSVIKNAPIKDGYYYTLKEDLMWEEHEMEIIELGV